MPLVQELDHDSVSMHIEAPAATLYELVADVTRMPELSPEIRRCTWLDGARGPAVGARFAAVNKLPRRPPWTNKPVVTIAEPGRVFAFSRTEKIGGTMVWTYGFEPEGTGTLVTESYEVTEPIPWFGWLIIGGLFGRKDRRADLRAGMEQTLGRMRVLAQHPE